MYENNITQPYPIIKPLVLSDAETFQRGRHIYNIYLSASMRDASHPQFDGMTYLEYNETNEKADNAFIPPKLNKYDTRTNAGLARQKITTINSILCNFEFEPEFEAYDDNDQIIDELGQIATELVRKADEVDHYDEKRPQIYREMLRQGDVDVEVRCVYRYYKDKTMRSPIIDFSRMSSLQWSDGERKEEVIETHLIDGKKIFLGDIRQSDIRLQPYIFTVEYITREQAYSEYGYFERFDSVPFYVQKTMWTNDNTIFTDWVYAEINQYKVEVIKYMSKCDDELQIYLNGVPILPCYERANKDVSGFPLSVMSPSGEYPIARGSLQPLALFAYSKSIAAELKVDEAIATEDKRLNIIKKQQSTFPPVGNMGSKVLGPDLWMPAKIHQSVSAQEIEPLSKNLGLTDADFKFTEYLENQMGKKSITDVMEGQQTPTGVSATQFLDMKRQQMTKISSIFDAVVNFEKQRAYLVLCSVLEHWTKPIDQRVDPLRKGLVDVFKTVTIDTTFEDGTSGKRIINFDPTLAKTMTPAKVHKMEKDSNFAYKYAFINPDILRQLKVTWRTNMVPTEKNSNDLERRKFKEDITDAMTLFGPQSLNVEALKKRYAEKAGEKFDTFFSSNTMMPMDASGGGMGAGMMGGGGAKPKSPAGGLPSTQGGGAKDMAASGMY